MATMPATVVEDRKKDQLETQERINQLVSENAGLEEEKRKILTALRSERTIRKNFQKESKIKEKEKNEEIHSLRESLKEEKNISLSAKLHWTGEFNRVVRLLRQEQERNRESQEKKINGILSTISNHNLMDKDAKLQTLAEDNDRKLSHVVQEKDDLMKMKTALKVKYLESEAKLTEKERQIIQREAEFETKLATLEDQMTCELAAKESFEKRHELERESREMEWNNKESQMENEIKLLKEQNSDLQVQNHSLQELEKNSRRLEEWINKESQMENEIKILKEQNSDLQVQNHSLQELEKNSRRMETEWITKESQMENKIKILKAQNSDLKVNLLSLQEPAQKTDKEKARMKKQEEKEEKAQKAEEKRLKKETKEAEEQENQQKEENKNPSHRGVTGEICTASGKADIGYISEVFPPRSSLLGPQDRNKSFETAFTEEGRNNFRFS
ncbi:trichohyalin-like [Perca flavescens]|uniref:trichohyalin-like n=1 Tax=Perca flavescens TaxID=8167 RepID=UPI00106E175D|nr:trichohyalin-like [Perca flavescens]